MGPGRDVLTETARVKRRFGNTTRDGKCRQGLGGPLPPLYPPSQGLGAGAQSDVPWAVSILGSRLKLKRLQFSRAHLVSRIRPQGLNNNSSLSLTAQGCFAVSQRPFICIPSGPHAVPVVTYHSTSLVDGGGNGSIRAARGHTPWASDPRSFAPPLPKEFSDTWKTLDCNLGR